VFNGQNGSVSAQRFLLSFYQRLGLRLDWNQSEERKSISGLVNFGLIGQNLISISNPTLYDWFLHLDPTRN